MIGKLIKNEFKTSAHTMGMIYLAAVITVGLMLLAYLFDIGWISVVATIALAIIGVVAVIVTFVCVVANFQKTLFGNQGYLSFTLPVTTGQLLASKAIVSFAWMLLSYIAGLAIFVGIYAYSTAMIGDNVMTALKLLLNMFADLPSEATIKFVVGALIFLVFLKMIMLIAQLFFAITLSNTRSMQKFGAFAPIIIFFALFIIMSVASTALSNFVPVVLVVSLDGISMSFTESMADSGSIAFGIAGTVFDIVASAFLFVATSAIMDNKINIK